MENDNLINKIKCKPTTLIKDSSLGLNAKNSNSTTVYVCYVC